MRKLDKLQATYGPRDTNVDLELFLPISEITSSMDCMVGYFTSGALGRLAVSISCYLSASAENKMRFIISPYMDQSDLNALSDAYNSDEDVLDLLFPGFNISESNLRNNSVEALCYLVMSNRLEIRIALQERGIWHKKIWLFKTSEGNVSVHGSSNATGAGLQWNTEELSVDRVWRGVDQQERWNKYTEDFERAWNNKEAAITVKQLNQKTLQKMQDVGLVVKEKYPEIDSLQDQLIVSLKEEKDSSFQVKLKTGLQIPERLNGNLFSIRAHQLKAIGAWQDAHYKGILELATGSGKTITSLYAATKVFNAKKNKAERLALIISVPYVALAEQWCENLKDFTEIPPIKCWGARSLWLSRLKDHISSFRYGELDFFALVVVNRTMEKPEFKQLFASLPSENLMLIGDECHNHGAEKTNKSLVDAYFRMGLSATPWNRDDDEFDSPFPNFAKTRIQNYYTEIVSKYTLADAINDGILCEYEYHIVPVYLNDDEYEKYKELSAEIGKLIQRNSNAKDSTKGSSTQLTIKCGERSRLLGSAENKFVALDELIQLFPKESRKNSLFYCGEGMSVDLEDDNSHKALENERLIEKVSKILGSRGWKSSRFTSEENALDRSMIMENFKSQHIDALVSVRVLDEGVDIPACDKAFIMASTKNPRQYIQRRGRVLRKAPGKEKSDIYDFIVLPPADSNDPYAEKLRKSEKERVDDYCILASNKREIENDIERLGL